MLSEQKNPKNKNQQLIITMLMSSQDVTLLLYNVISSRRDLVLVSFKHVYNYLIKLDDVAI